MAPGPRTLDPTLARRLFLSRQRLTGLRPAAAGPDEVMAAVTDLAATTDVATARCAARAVELPSDKITFTGPRWPWLPTTQVIGLSLLGYAALYTFRRIRRTRAHRRLDSTSGRPGQLRSTT